MAFYDAGAAKRTASKAAFATRCQRGSREPAFLVSRGSGRPGDTAHAERSRAGLAPVVLPVEQPAGRRAARARRGLAPEPAARAGRAGASGCWPTIARRRSSRTSRSSGSHVAKLDEIVPDRGQFPQASGLLDPRELMKEELRLFVDSVLRSDRSVVDLLTADYTFLNERLAMHYGIETVKGARFRRVTLPTSRATGCSAKAPC